MLGFQVFTKEKPMTTLMFTIGTTLLVLYLVIVSIHLLVWIDTNL